MNTNVFPILMSTSIYPRRNEFRRVGWTVVYLYLCYRAMLNGVRKMLSVSMFVLILTFIVFNLQEIYDFVALLVAARSDLKVETLSDPNYSVSQYVYCTVRSILLIKLP